MKLKMTLAAVIASTVASISSSAANEPIQLVPATLPPIESHATITFLDSVYVKRPKFEPTSTTSAGPATDSYDALLTNASFVSPAPRPIFVGCVPGGFLPIVRNPLEPLSCDQIKLYERRDGVLTKVPVEKSDEGHDRTLDSQI